MTRLNAAWSNAWELLPSEAHEVLTKTKYGRQLPNDRAVRGIFSMAFSDLPTKHRSNPEINGTRDINQIEAAEIARQVAEQADRLVSTVRLLRILQQKVTRESLGVGDKRESLLAFAWVKSEEYDEHASEDEIDELLDEFLRVPNSTGVSRLLDDDEVTEEIARDLAVVDFPARPADGGQGDGWDTLADFLDDADLASYDHAAAPPPSEESIRRWQAVLAADLNGWHWRAQALGLTEDDEPQRPVVRERRPRVPTAVDDGMVRWLDSSLERRVCGALKGRRILRVGLPGELELVQAEVNRAAAPLGLQSREARAVMALGAALMILVQSQPYGAAASVQGDGLASTAASSIVGAQFRKWRRIRAETSGVSGFPRADTAPVFEDSSGVQVEDRIVNAFEDPVGWYCTLLWRRIHGHEVRNGLPSGPVEAWSLLTGLALTATGRLDELAVKLGSQATKPVASTINERVDTVLSNLLASGISPEVLHAFCIKADAEDAMHRKQWREWTRDLAVRLSLREFVTWRNPHVPE